MGATHEPLRDLDLDAFFHPRTVALIGASDTPKRPNTAMTNKVRAWAEANGAEVWPVNPNRDEVDGLRCYRTLADVPGRVDLAVILVGDPMAVLDDVLDSGASFGVIFAAGFAEVGLEGEARQAELERRLAAGGTRILGPNTNLNAFELFDQTNPGRAVALITQSGHQGRPIFQAQELGLNLRYWAPTGNEADLEFADFVAHFADSDEVGVIATYVEGFASGATVLRAADRAARSGTPIVAVKVGRTEEGRAMARSHTGHLTGADDVVDAVFRQYGITRVTGLDELQDAAAMFSLAGPPRTDGVCVYAVSGGTGAHMADMVADEGLHLPELTAETTARLRAVIPDYLRVDNPVDSGGPPSSHPEHGREILDAIVADPKVGVVIVPITGVYASMGTQFAEHLVAVAETTDKPICVVWGSPMGDEEAYTRILRKSRCIVFRTFGNCVRTVRAWMDHHDFAARYVSPFDAPARAPAGARDRALSLLDGRDAVSEHTAKQVLQAYGIPTTRDVLATSAAEALAAAADLGPTVVLKACGPTLEHKSDLGLVKVGVSAADAGQIYDHLAPRAAKAAGGDFEGVLVCEQVDTSMSVECVIGVVRDELFGPTVMLGLGGVFIEVLRDVTFRVPPFGTDEVERMLRELRGYPMLTGTRGTPPADLDALVDTVMKVQTLAVDLRDVIDELDINPLLVGPKGCVALDALFVPRQP